jgi:hypothetical protein
VIRDSGVHIEEHAHPQETHLEVERLAPGMCALGRFGLSGAGERGSERVPFEACKLLVFDVDMRGRLVQAPDLVIAGRTCGSCAWVVGVEGREARDSG